MDLTRVHASKGNRYGQETILVLLGRTFVKDKLSKLSALFLAAASNVAAAKLVCAKKLSSSHRLKITHELRITHTYKSSILSPYVIMAIN